MSPVLINPHRHAAGGVQTVFTKVGSFNLGTGSPSTTVAVTGVGFQPKVVLFWWNGLAAAENASSDTLHLRGGFGFAVSPTDRHSVYGTSRDAGITSETDTHQRNDTCIGAVAVSTGASDGRADLSSMDSNGFTLIIDEAFSVDLRIQYLAIGGAGVTAKGGEYTATGTGSLGVTGVGFQPDAIFFFCTGAGVTNASTSDMRIGFGAATAANSWVLAIGGNDGTHVRQKYLRSGQCSAAIHFNFGAITSRQSLTSMDADGFTVNVLEAGSNILTHFVAIDGISVKAGLIAQPSDATESDITDHGFTPRAILLVQHDGAENADDTVASENKCSIGAATGPSERYCMYWGDADGSPTNQIALLSRNDAVGVIATEPGTTIESQTDITTFSSSTVRLAMDDTISHVLAHAYVLIGEP